jgi:hypothetical protein
MGANGGWCATSNIHPDLLSEDSDLRWHTFVERLARNYESRFEGQEEAAKAAESDAANTSEDTGEAPAS